MKRKNLAKKLTALMMTGAMVMSMGMTAFAVEDGENIADTTEATAEITKIINKPENVLTPNTSFQFSINYVGETTGVPETDIDTYRVSRAVAFEYDNDTITPTEDEKKDVTDSLIYSEKLPLEVLIENFTIPGVYRYEVKEIKPEDEYEGVFYDETPLYFDVAVGYYQNSHVLTVLYSMFVTENEEGETVKGNGTITNEYGVGQKEGELGNLILKKTISGNQVQAGKEYEFTVNITSGETGEEYYIVYSDGETQYTEDGSAQIKLKADETATIYGLSTSDKYTIIEHDYENEGYTTSFEIKDTKGEVEKSATGEHVYSTTETTLRKDDDGKLMDANVTFNNAKEAITPTGIAMTFAPYIAMVAFAGVFAVMFLRKKREDF